MLYHERERKNKENANVVYIVYLLTVLCNIFDEAFFIDVSIVVRFGHERARTCDPFPTEFLSDCIIFL